MRWRWATRPVDRAEVVASQEVRAATYWEKAFIRGKISDICLRRLTVVLFQSQNLSICCDLIFSKGLLHLSSKRSARSTYSHLLIFSSRLVYRGGISSTTTFDDPPEVETDGRWVGDEDQVCSFHWTCGDSHE